MKVIFDTFCLGKNRTLHGWLMPSFFIYNRYIIPYSTIHQTPRLLFVESSPLPRKYFALQPLL